MKTDFCAELEVMEKGGGDQGGGGGGGEGAHRHSDGSTERGNEQRTFKQKVKETETRKKPNS